MIFLKKVLIGLIALCILIIGVIFILKSIPFIKKSVIRADGTAVITQIRKLNRLETAQFTIETIIEAGAKDERFGGILFGDKLLLIANGQVVAGVDLTTMTEGDIIVKDSNLSVALPAPKIFSVTLDNTKTRVYDRQKGLLSTSEKDLESEARLAAEGKIRQAACEGGILVEAETNAKEQLEALFSTLGFKSVTVSVPVGEC
ncbi:MAG: DUF4230 domain-containing protein [Candidatus Roizmanbacteria bacterium]|nr:DUF4230 domain-containing protein [Candidatus Roizmanbacteria bacterium]